MTELGSTASYLSQAEMVFPPSTRGSNRPNRPQGHPGKAEPGPHRRARRRIPADAGNQLKKDYITAYIASHSKARLGVAEDKTRNALRKDDRLLALRVLAGVADAHQPAHRLRGTRSTA